MQDLESFLSQLSASQHHIEHYNHMVTSELPSLIDNFMTFFETDEHSIEISFANAHMARASYMNRGKNELSFPGDCRRRELTYSSFLYASVIQKKTFAHSGEQKVSVLNKVPIALIPTMIGSCLCNLTHNQDIRAQEECFKDVGGYFIVNGNERVLVTQEMKAYNTTLVSKTKGNVVAAMRSMSDETAHSVVVECTVPEDKVLSKAAILLPYVSKKVSIGIFFRALGYDDAKEIYNEVAVYRPEVEQALIDSFAATQMSQDDALLVIGKLRSKFAKVDDDDVPEDVEDDYVELDQKELEEIEAQEVEIKSVSDIAYARQVIESEIFPHLGIRSSKSMIFQMVCYMLKMMFSCRLGIIESSERDNLMFKRFENSGSLILKLCQICLKHFFGTMKQNYSGNNVNEVISKLFTFMTKTIHSNFAKGIWGIPKNAYVRYGVSQILSRLSYIGMLSHLQRINIPIGQKGKNIKVRLIHPSHFGYICLYETPEGAKCGIVINMTISCRITRKFSTNFMRDVIVKQFALNESAGDVEIWLNNSLKFYAENAAEFISRFRSLRAEGMIPHYVNIYFEPLLNTIHILSDSGRITRPFKDRAGNVVWIDSAENQYSSVAMYPSESADFEYVEIHPCLMYGIAAGCIPFSDHNQSPRNVYESSMLKQALGIPTTSYSRRYDTSFELMPTVQRSILSTAISRSVGCPELPAGVNCIVAIMTCGSWNAEDSLVFNQQAIQRGLFHSVTLKSISSEEYQKDSNIVKKFCLPPEKIRNPIHNYDLLDQDGIVKKGSLVKKKDIIFGKVREEKDGSLRDCSEMSDEEGIVERVDFFKSVNGYKSAKVTLKIEKIPERGDKFANMCAQKGTIGMILPQVDMPFTPEGIVPDVIINPNALPSRMTISMFLEMVLGKYGCLSGNFVDATPFSENSTDVANKISNLLAKYGFERNGSEFMISGETGEPLQSRIFIGTSYYQKLKHMVSNKIHARPHGNVTTLTRQPPAGRSKDGGLKIGEMERDALLSHGVSSFLTSRIFDRSDAFHVAVCNNCQVMSNHKDECHICKSSDLIWTRLPFASKLLFQQLTACLIGTKFSSELL